MSPPPQARASPRSTPAKPASTSTPAPSPTSIRISSARAVFAGKGIYEVSILQQVLDRRFPRNALLSHDLIEGSYARAGLVTDIEIIDDYPSHYSAHTRRKHRWVRGDWQIARWLLNRVPDESGNSSPTPSTPSPDGRSSTTSADRSSNLSPSSSSSSAGSYFPVERSTGPSPASSCSFSRASSS